MKKIISFNSLKNNIDRPEISINEEREVYALIDELSFDKVFMTLDNLVKDYGYTEKIKNMYTTTLMLILEDVNPFQAEKYIDTANKLYMFNKDDKTLCIYISNFYANIYEILDNEMQEIVSKNLKTLYESYKDSEEIAFYYCMNILTNVTFSVMSEHKPDNSFFIENEKIIADVYNDFSDNEDIASVYANYIYFTSEIYTDDMSISSSHIKLKKIYAQFPDVYDCVLQYVSFLGDRCIGKNIDECIFYLSELKKIYEELDNFGGAKRGYAISLSNICSYQKYKSSKGLIKELINVATSDDSDSFLIEFALEVLGDFSCEEDMTYSIIKDEIMPKMYMLIDTQYESDNFMFEYALILYNLICLSSYSTSEHIEPLEELRRLSTTYEITIPYYCLALSNLIHLSALEECYKIVDEIKQYYKNRSQSHNYRTKNMLSLKTILSIALSNLIKEIDNIDDALKYLLEIKSLLVTDKTNTLFIEVPEEPSEDFLQIFKQYIRALSYYAEKQSGADKIESINLIEQLQL